jgi:hypothetical protein
MKYHSSCFLAISLVFFLLSSGELASSAEVGLNFTAMVTASTGSPYGTPIPGGTDFFGHLAFESNTPVYETPPTGCSDCASYRHFQTNGLHVEFPGLTVEADEYLVYVKNDHNVTGYGLADIIGVWFPDQTLPSPTPDLDASLLINGSPVSKGSFRMELVAPSTTLPDAQLPATIDPSVFEPTAGNGTFGDGMPNANFPDLFFKPQSVTDFPHSTSDHDLDGDVDGTDFLIWQRAAGQNKHDGDADSNLLVDGNDLELWQAEYGSNVTELAAADIAVPEPAALALVCGACLIGMCRR